MYRIYIVLVQCLLVGVFAREVPQIINDSPLDNYSSDTHLNRQPRFIREAVTQTVYQDKVVTSLVPSSCVYVDPSLPPCRNVRYLRFPSFITTGLNQQFGPIDAPPASDKSGGQINSTSLSWGEYLGFYPRTETVTKINLHTTVVQDPRIMVTFAVKGCKPLKIPGDLNRCADEGMTPLPIQEILPTSTVALTYTKTALPIDNNLSNHRLEPELYTNKNVNEIDENVGYIESSTVIRENLEASKATQPLPFP
ncbi:unnamed protein product [Acanthoscelides obtectus]|uniref:Uncharacterized protein n=1 Tax=Acanthoscelides obtectus TaxID=200917 RepID=A0A9P0Q9C1_ACAOB|nr:unnamed protein product [Acanthoscelides obtectus]CAH2013683.1 unnamed protein product [Acanthoscelides obtectus]CAH2015080.1 unnamed protein product [Acanthoscelides obtectus]CAK1625338.1 hypothetical protein AOBTE_LOCUS3114 [Acanthoscelides obtectus]CAK1625372.1 hypothetical protein AOBTE_LOCUS3130 [Acanthoscelides obtectus]